MFNQPANDDLINKYVDLFGYLFKDVVIIRTDDNATGLKYQRETVPIEFGPVEKYIARNEQDPDLTKSVSVQLPRMAYELNSLFFDASRNLNPVNKINLTGADGVRQIRYVPVPYNFAFSLYIMARNVQDNWKIFESIAPFFTPSYTISADLLNNGLPFDIKLDMNMPGLDQQYEGQFLNYSKNVWEIPFILSGWLFGPDLSGQAGTQTIKWVRNDIYSALTKPAPYAQANTYVTEANTNISDIEPTDNYTIVTVNTDG